MPFGKYKDFKDCVDSNQDRENPEAYCAQIEKNITGKWPKEEKMKTHKIESATLKEASPKKITIKGLLLPKDRISRNGVLYDWDTVKQNYEKLIGLPMLYNHQNEGLAKPVGHFTDSYLKEHDDKDGIAGWYYEADVNPKSEYADSIIRGDINKVSVQIIAGEQKSEKTEDDIGYTRAYISDVLESSAVPTPGFMETTMAVMCESFKVIKESAENPGVRKLDGTGPNPNCDKKEFGEDDDDEEEFEENGMTTANISTRTKLVKKEESKPFRALMNDPKFKDIVEQIEDIGDSREPRLLTIKKQLIDELKKKFNYRYIESLFERINRLANNVLKVGDIVKHNGILVGESLSERLDILIEAKTGTIKVAGKNIDVEFSPSGKKAFDDKGVEYQQLYKDRWVKSGKPNF